jgi:two-component system sensor histidine kinase KdpD
LHRIVDNLLVLARLEQGQRLESEPTLVRRIINRVIQEHRRRFPGRAIELHHDEKLIPALASPEYTEQVVRNLLSNAEKYSPRESVIEVHIGKEDEDLVVRVLDRGQGIDESELENVFTPFYRSPANSPAAPGAGIGLAVCKRLVEAQSGRIWAKRRDGGGSEFGFSVPIADDDGS